MKKDLLRILNKDTIKGSFQKSGEFFLILSIKA